MTLKQFTIRQWHPSTPVYITTRKLLIENSEILQYADLLYVVCF